MTKLKPTARIMGVEEYRLPNGFRFVMAVDESKPTFTANLVVHAGSIHEGPGESGLAHVFEHILTHTLEGFPDLRGTLQKLGAPLGEKANASTWFDRTNFHETVPAGDENLQTVIKMEAARLGRAALLTQDLDKEREIVDREFDLRRNSHQMTMFRHLFGTMFHFHPYSRDPIGTPEDFKSITIEQIRAFYARHYRPDNATLILTGAFARDLALAKVREYFGKLAPGTAAPIRFTREPAAAGERNFVLREPGDIGQVLVAYRVPRSSSREASAAQLVSRMVLGEKSGALYKAVVDAGLGSSVVTAYMSLRMACPWLVLAEVPKPENAEAAARAIQELLEGRLEGFTQADLERAQSRISHEFSDIMANAELMAHMLGEYEAAGSWKLMFVRHEQTRTMSLGEVFDFARVHLRAENRVTGIFVPDHAAVPVAVEVEPTIESYDELLSRLDPEAPKTEAFDYSPEAVQKAVGWHLIGDIRAALLRKKSNGEKVHICLNIPLGGVAALRKRSAAVAALVSIFQERTRTYSREEVQAILARGRTSIGAGVQDGCVVIAVETAVDSVKETLGILGEQLRSPYFDLAQFEAHRARKEAALTAIADHPGLLISIETNRLLRSEDDPRRSPPVEEQLSDLRELTVDKVMEAHAELLGSKGIVAAVVGDLSSADMVELFWPLTEEGWTSRLPSCREPDNFDEGPMAAVRSVKTPGKPASFQVVAQTLKCCVTDPDFWPLQAATWALCSGGLTARIPHRMREKERLSYSVGGELQSPLRGDRSVLYAVATTSGGKAGQAEAIIKEEFLRAIEQGITPAEVDAFKDVYSKGKTAERAADDRIAGSAVDFDLVSEDFSLWTRQDKEVEELTVQQVNEVLRKHVDPAKMSTLEIGDF